MDLLRPFASPVVEENSGAISTPSERAALRIAPPAEFQVIHLPARTLVPILLLAPLGCAQSPTSPADPSQGLPQVAEQRTAAEAKRKPSPKAEQRAGADENPELPSVAERWAAAFSKGDLDALMSLYDEDALMWGTSASKMRKGSSAIRQYYAQLLQAFPGIRVSLEETSPRRYGDAGVNSGSFTMRRVSSDGTVSVTSARFSMFYVRRGGKWLIVDHHSSFATR